MNRRGLLAFLAAAPVAAPVAIAAASRHSAATYPYLVEGLAGGRILTPNQVRVAFGVDRLSDAELVALKKGWAERLSPSLGISADDLAVTYDRASVWEHGWRPGLNVFYGRSPDVEKQMRDHDIFDLDPPSSGTSA